MSDEQLAGQVGGLRSRAEIIATSDVVLLPKPTLEDVDALRPGQVLWGWPHAVQDAELTQLAIDKRLTLIAWEAMNHWTPAGGFVVHVFHLNNEMAGYCSVLHAMTLTGSTGHYGRHLTAAVIGFGNTARGSVTALNALGVNDVTVLTMRDVTAVASPIPSIVLDHMERRADDPRRTVVRTPTGAVPTAALLARHDIVVNCVLQDTDAPLMFVSTTSSARSPRAACWSTCPATPAWASSAPGRPRSRSPSSRSATASPTTASTTARRTSGTARPGASARRWSPTCAR